MKHYREPIQYDDEAPAPPFWTEIFYPIILFAVMGAVAFAFGYYLPLMP